MIQIVLNDEQAKVVRKARDEVELRDHEGVLLGYLSRPVPQAILDEVNRRLKYDGPWRTTEQVLERLRSLEQ